MLSFWSLQEKITHLSFVAFENENRNVELKWKYLKHELHKFNIQYVDELTKRRNKDRR